MPPRRAAAAAIEPPLSPLSAVLDVPAESALEAIFEEIDRVVETK